MALDPKDSERVLLTIHGVKIAVQRCAQEDGADRCTEPGTLSETPGAAQRWCHAHFPPFVAWQEAKQNAAHRPASLLLPAERPTRRPDPEAEAERAALQADGVDPALDSPEAPWLDADEEPAPTTQPGHTQPD